MKRIIFLSLIVCYLLSSIGITISAHYCGGELAEQKVSFLPSNGNCCDNEEEEDMSCCSNEHTLLKIKDNQELSAFILIKAKSFFSFCISSSPLILLPTTANQFLYSRIHAPPDVVSLPIFLRFRTLLI